MINPEKRAELVRSKMMKDRKYLIARIKGSGQERDPKKILDNYFRYRNYVSGDNEYELEWLKKSLESVWSPKFVGLVDNIWERPIDEVKRLEHQNPAYSAAFRLKGKLGDPRDYNKVFTIQVSGCTLSCNYCYVPPEVNAANSELGNFFYLKEIINYFLKAKEKSKEPMNVVRISGGEPTIIPEIILDTYSEIEKIDGTYLWIDTNLSITKYLEKLEGDLKDIMQKRNVGVVGCFKGVSKEDFSILTGAEPRFYENQFESAKLFLDWKSDFYVYLPALIYENNIEQKTRNFINRLQGLNNNLPLRVEMLIIKEYPGAIINIEKKAKQGRPLPKTNQRIVFDLWHNKLLPEFYPKENLEKYCCEVPL